MSLGELLGRWAACCVCGPTERETGEVEIFGGDGASVEAGDVGKGGVDGEG